MYYNMNTLTSMELAQILTKTYVKFGLSADEFIVFVYGSIKM